MPVLTHLLIYLSYRTEKAAAMTNFSFYVAFVILLSAVAAQEESSHLA